MNFFTIILVILFIILGNLFIVFMNTRIVMKGKRTKRWDCNYATIAIDEEKKIIALLEPAFLDFKAFEINGIDISSKKIVPPSAVSKSPGLSTAPVNAPLAVPKNILSRRFSGIAAQF